MRARRTPSSNRVFQLAGGTEDNDLWARVDSAGGVVTVSSVWELTDDERAAVAAGANIELTVWGPGTPPVSMRTTDERIGARRAG